MEKQSSVDSWARKYVKILSEGRGGGGKIKKE